MVVYSVGELQAESVKQGFGLGALGLAVLGALFGSVGLIIVAQTSARLVAANAPDARTLQSIGWDRRSLIGLAVARMLAISSVGAMAAVAVAVVMSPMWPAGDAGLAEVDGGLAVDPFVLAAVVLFIVVAFPTMAGWQARASAGPVRSAGAPDSTCRPSGDRRSSSVSDSLWAPASGAGRFRSAVRWRRV